MTIENMKCFIVQCWSTKSKPNVEQGKKWLNHALTRNHRPPLNKSATHLYHDLLDLLKGIAKDPEWREHKAAKTDAFSLDICKRIFHAPVTNLEGQLDLKAVRNKALGVCMIVNGWHPIDAYRITDADVVDKYDYHDRTGEHRPKLIFQGRQVHHTKLKNLKVKNTVGCGCLHNHNPNYNHCFYNVVKCYMDNKNACDERFVQNDLRKLNKKARDVHLTEDMELAPTGFFRAMARHTCPQRCRRSGVPRPRGGASRAPGSASGSNAGYGRTPHSKTFRTAF